MGGGLPPPQTPPSSANQSIHPSIHRLSIVATACCTRPLSKLQNVPDIFNELLITVTMLCMMC